ncbi:uncharacterized protein SOCE26_052640 [Sorangium cellulosum]|uniref:Low-complexity protein n=1 Tax=Sorangium cellulosum TaxID=56 RepID=A0A2L0EX36_SORCE|nr:pentapeptide repeat-containing protein [Sorangium cellulosum]AUX43809.1 uncharacterized protein SOCE26_052640 [Sorangium cellulosum]
MIVVELTWGELVEAGACRAELDAFLDVFGEPSPGGALRLRWTPLHAVWLAKVHPTLSAWLVIAGLLPVPHLEYADLRGADLRGVSLGGARLAHVDLSGADLRGAYLAGADLRWASLRGVNLSGADLRGVNLTGARGVELARTDGADLTGAVVGFDGASAPLGWRVVVLEGGRPCRVLRRVSGRETGAAEPNGGAS